VAGGRPPGTITTLDRCGIVPGRRADRPGRLARGRGGRNDM
ncbi:MAG: hypothetical protein AVDCRST_MAG70-1081, partial [uncultured Thermomicrobiales bacterium]